MFTAGGADGIVNMWMLHTPSIDAQITAGGEGTTPFLNVIDGSGAFYKEMEDFFYYSQLQS